MRIQENRRLTVTIKSVTGKKESSGGMDGEMSVENDEGKPRLSLLLTAPDVFIMSETYCIPLAPNTQNQTELGGKTDPLLGPPMLFVS